VELPAEVIRIAEYIRDMRIRGAGRIARAAVHAMKLAAAAYEGHDRRDFLEYMERVAQLLKSTRPTAVSLPNAVNYVMVRVRSAKTLKDAIAAAVRAADEFTSLSLRAVETIGRIGAGLLEDGDVVLTHCNSSAALSVIKMAFREGKRLKVYATETRPRFQGLISYRELTRAGIPTTLIPDSAVRFFMKEVDKVVVGADAVAANGAVVNKVGTSMIALAAHEARVRFYVAAETYKFSPATVLGELVTIEERDPREVVSSDILASSPHLRVRNPAFDVTPPEYIDAIITERGVIPPKAAILVLKEEYGRMLEEELTRITLDIEDSAYPAQLP